MKFAKSIAGKFSVLYKFRFKLVLLIAVVWTIIDTLYILIRFKWLHISSRYYFFEYREPWAVGIREIVVLFMSFFMSFLESLVELTISAVITAPGAIFKF